jgi:hypothetical protein
MTTVSQVIQATIESVKSECWIGEPSQRMIERHARKHAGETFRDMLPFIVGSVRKDIEHETRRDFVAAMKDEPGTTFPINLQAFTRA